MSKYFTGTGDDGYSSTLGEGRVPKHHMIMEAIGTLDEVSAALGIVRAVCQAPLAKSIVIEIQHDLYKMMTELAALTKNPNRLHMIDDDRVSWIEQQINFIGHKIDKPEGFIVPGDTYSGSFIDFARAVVRRAERRVSKLLDINAYDHGDILKYLNRMSSLCFLLELLENQTMVGSSHTLVKEYLGND